MRAALMKGFDKINPTVAVEVGSWASYRWTRPLSGFSGFAWLSCRHLRFCAKIHFRKPFTYNLSKWKFPLLKGDKKRPICGSHNA